MEFLGLWMLMDNQVSIIKKKWYVIMLNPSLLTLYNTWGLHSMWSPQGLSDFFYYFYNEM